jgi:hypothetical protein
LTVSSLPLRSAGHFPFPSLPFPASQRRIVLGITPGIRARFDCPRIQFVTDGVEVGAGHVVYPTLTPLLRAQSTVSQPQLIVKTVFASSWWMSAAAHRGDLAVDMSEAFPRFSGRMLEGFPGSVHIEFVGRYRRTGS